MKGAITGTFVGANISDFTNEKNETFTFARVIIIDEDGFLDKEKFFIASLKLQEAQTMGFDNQENVKPFIGRKVVLEGKWIWKRNRDNEKEFKFVAENVKFPNEK